jgi:stage V sporulation protein SpoVS
MFEAFRAMFASGSAPDPHDVATAIAKLIAAPKGSRPARVVVGQAFGADAVNDVVAPIQRQVIETLGLGPLAS